MSARDPSPALRIPPHSVEAEQSLIGGLLLFNEAWDRVADIVLEPDFYRDDHRRIFRHIVRILEVGKPADVVTVFESLEGSGEADQTGGLAYLGEIAANTPSAANIRRYAEIVRDRATLRRLMRAGDVIAGLADDPSLDLDGKLQQAQAEVLAISESGAGGEHDPQPIGAVMTRHVETVESRRDGKVVSLPTGFDDVDALLNGGFRAGQLIIGAARPGMGKTSFALQVAHHTASRGRPVLVLSMEMPEADIADRLVSSAHGLPLSNLVAGDLSDRQWAAYSDALGALHRLPLYVDDKPGLTLLQVATKARKVKRMAGGLSLVVIDYLQLMNGQGESRNAEIERISRGLKSLAKEMGVPIIALSQLSRKCEDRPNKRPFASDLRDSGSLEQDADVILCLYRDEVYDSDSADKGTAEVMVRKNRQGRIGEARLSWRGECASFGNLDHSTWAESRRAAAEKRAQDKPMKRRSGAFNDD